MTMLPARPSLASALVLTLCLVAGHAAAQATGDGPTGGDQPTGPSDATPATQQLELDANTPQLCKLGETSAPSIPLGVIAQLSGGAAGRLRTDIGERLVTVDAWCNTSSQISVTAQAMLGPAFGDTPATSVFARTVNFRARATGWTADADAPAITSDGDRLGNGDVSRTSDGANVDGPNQATLSIRLDQFAVPANSLLISGDYAGAVIVTISPL
jgi:hypothetical protein